MQTSQLNYFSDSSMEAEFNEFRKLKTEAEKETFRILRKADFDKKTPAEKKAYHEATKTGLEAIEKRVDELFEKAGKTVFC